MDRFSFGLVLVALQALGGVDIFIKRYGVNAGERGPDHDGRQQEQCQADREGQFGCWLGLIRDLGARRHCSSALICARKSPYREAVRRFAAVVVNACNDGCCEEGTLVLRNSSPVSVLRNGRSPTPGLVK